MALPLHSIHEKGLVRFKDSESTRFSLQIGGLGLMKYSGS